MISQQETKAQERQNDNGKRGKVFDCEMKTKETGYTGTGRLQGPSPRSPDGGPSQNCRRLAHEQRAARQS